jgi:hypothetical protein
MLQLVYQASSPLAAVFCLKREKDMANNQNLKPFKEGYDERRGTKPKGSKHLSTYIREILDDEDFEYKLANGKKIKGVPALAMVKALVVKAVEGDTKAFDLLAKYGYGTKVELDLNDKYVPEITSEQAKQLLNLMANNGKL